MKNEILGIVESQKDSNMQKQMNEYGENKKNYMNELGYTINYYKNKKDLFENIKDDQTNLSRLINEIKIAEYLFSNDELYLDNEKDIEKYLKAINEKILSSENFTFYITEGIDLVINIGSSGVCNKFETEKHMIIDYIPSINENLANKIRLRLSGLSCGRIIEGFYDIFDNGIIESHFIFKYPTSNYYQELTSNEFIDGMNIDVNKLNEVCEIIKQVLKNAELTEEPTIKHNK